MPALLMRMSRRPNFSAAPLTKARHAASVPTSACVKETLAPAVSSSAATRSPRSPSRSTLDGRIRDLKDVKNAHRDVVDQVGQGARHADKSHLAALSELE